MKSNVFKLNKDFTNFNEILKEVEKAANYNNLEKRNFLRLRLLTEELIGILKLFVKDFEGDFWLENEEQNYELHVELEAETMTLEKRESLIAISKSGKNSAATGIMGKIRTIAEQMLLAVAEPNIDYAYFDYYTLNLGMEFINPADMIRTNHIWSLDNYKKNVESKQEDEAFSELEQSIVANLADDVIVGVKGKKVEITIKKKF